ncbi:MAG: hypothetical protein Tsb009_23910 [Planctomycetaceae bacterium]
MFYRTLFIAAFSLLILFSSPIANAQEVRIYTRIYDQSTKQPAIVGRTLALFRAGKVYDHIDSMGEVIIFEPMRSRFTILNTRRALATTIHFDEINRMLKSARQVSQEHLRKLQQRDDADGVAASKFLRHQLNPQFTTHFDRKTKHLTLSSPHLRYDARIKQVENKEFAETYRLYADWMNRLNYVLHPRMLLPGPRLKLNEQLHRHQSIPVEVTLRVNLKRPIHLRAEHQIQWSMFEQDRAQLNEWKSLLNDRTTRKLTFREYQRELAKKSVSRR